MIQLSFKKVILGLVGLTLHSWVDINASDLEQYHQGCIQGQYQKFRRLSPREVSRSLGAYQDILPQLCIAVQFLLYLNVTGDEDKHIRSAMILSNGSGVGGIDTTRTANPDEERVMIDCLHKSVKGGADISSFQLSRLGNSGVIGQHQNVIARAIQVIQSGREWDTRKSFNFIRDGEVYGRFKQAISGCTLSTGSMLDLPKTVAGNVLRNPNYGGMFPNVPVLHFYDAKAKPGFFFMAQQLNFSEHRSKLPFNVKRYTDAIDDHQIDLFFIGQYRMFKDKDTGDTLFRPHYWVSPNGHPWRHNVTASFLRADRGPTLSKERIRDTQNVHVHDGISSPNNFSVEDLLPKEDQSLSFWIIVHNPVTNRYALTLYWYLQWQDHDYLNKFSGDFKNLKNYVAYHPSLNRLCFPL